MTCAGGGGCSGCDGGGDDGGPGCSRGGPCFLHRNLTAGVSTSGHSIELLQQTR